MCFLCICIILFLGQLYFPQQSIRGGGMSSAENELYMQTLRSFQKLNSGSGGMHASANTSLFDFRGLLASQLGSTGPQGNAGSNACFALDLQRSAILTSGIPLSNSHQLSITYKAQKDVVTGAGNDVSYLVDVFLTYQICIRTFLSQCVLEV